MTTKRTVQTIADIARLAGVSKSTVSRALNDSPLIGADTKERIREIAHEHNFHINIPARRLSMQTSRTIAFVIHAYQCSPSFTIADLFLLEILGALSNKLSCERYDLLIAHVDPHDSEWPHAYLDTGRVDGFVLLTSTRKMHHIKALVDMQAPFIVWGEPMPGYSYNSVTGDNVAGGRLAAEHLVKQGRRRLAFIGGPADELEVRGRFEGFSSALADAGVALDPDLVTYGDYTTESAEERMRDLLARRPDIDAAFCNSDLMAVGAIHSVNAAGRKTPDDVAVIGYDDLTVAQLVTPALTTVSQNISLVGEQLAKNLISYLENGQVNNVTLPVELKVRESA